ncbi:MAG: S41 family peptidase [Candidatus Acidiferrales bacterium]
MASSKRGAFVFVIVLAISAILGGLYGPTVRATAAGSDDMQDSVKSFTRVLAVVQRNYADPVDTDKAIYDGAIPGMLQVLDPHSIFFDPRAWAQFQEQEVGRYYGVGMGIATLNNHTVVLAPFVGSPAFKAGIRPGDAILKVDGKSCEGLSSSDVANMLRGAKDTPVRISLGREGWDKPIEVSVVRNEIPRPGVDFYTMVKPGIGYVRVSTFNETTDSDLAAALAQLDVSKLDGLIIDLRNNGGGLLTQAVGIADTFLDKNELVVSHRGRSSPEGRFYAIRGNQGLKIPLVVLINGQSASASEIVAGSIQDHDRGLIVGETSFGKGLVQSQFPLSEKTGLLLITARYYTPSGRLIQRAYKNVTLYDYHYNPQPPRQPEVKLTDSGRQVFGGGGITPDYAVAAPKPNDFQLLLYRRNVFYPVNQTVGDFTLHFLSQKPQITRDFVVDDSVLRQFTQYLDQQHIKYTAQEIQDNRSWIQTSIKREVFASLFGLDEGDKVDLQDDPQLAKAEDLIPQAKALYQNARKIVAERQTGESLRP